MKIKQKIFLLLLPATSLAMAQNEIDVAQEVIYPELVNPATLGGIKKISLLLVANKSFNDIAGAPQLYSFNVRVPLSHKNIGFALRGDIEEIGARKQTRLVFSSDVAIPLPNEHYLSAGLGLGFDSRCYNIDYTGDLDHIDGVDLSALDGLYLVQTFGLSYRTSQFQLGIGNLYANQSRLNEQKNIFSVFVQSAYQIALPEDFSLTPMANYHYHNELGSLWNLAFLAQYQNRFGVGLSYQINRAISPFVEVKIADMVKLSYCSNIHTGKYKTWQAVSHEIGLKFDFLPWYNR